MKKIIVIPKELKKVYLCGNISTDPETYAWREKATLLLKGYRMLNPARNKFNQQLLKDHNSDPNKFTHEALKRSQGILIIKDFNLVQQADIILANLTLITPEKPLIGSVYELAWAWLLKKPVIAIIADNLYCQHPFPVETFSATASNLEEACKIIRTFFAE